MIAFSTLVIFVSVIVADHFLRRLQESGSRIPAIFTKPATA